MDVFCAYAYSTAGWLTLQSLPLIAGPSMIVAMLLDETRPASPIEVYLARCLGFCLLTMAVLTVIQTGLIPLTAEEVMEPATADDTDSKAPYAVPTLMVTSMFHAVSASYAYIWYVASGQGTFVVGIAGYFVLAAMGLWCMLFASSHSKISRRNGTGKVTTNVSPNTSEAAKKSAAKKPQ
ncbi:hypothetical protein N7505_007409 [Penicillium chrysogenum]|uniref:Uncharacterized protein n=2 Tax=Penicillium chrysogenum TaxID=5076 RepID=A0ABQ8WD95_PENCH|nr:hypothetical protein N7505_007409 [Penicillium chrysogenum]